MADKEQIPQELFERIERYVMHAMPESERTTFEEELARDMALRDNVQETRLLLLGVMEKSLRERLPFIHRRAFPGNNVRSLRWWWAAAAALLLAGFLAWVFIMPHKDGSLFATYYSPDPGLPTTMGPSESYAFERAMVDYKAGDYPQALEKWEKLLSGAPGSDTLLYFIGSAYLAKEDVVKSIPYLQKVAGNDSSAFREDACWYLGLAYLQQRNPDEAKRWIGRSAHRDKELLLNKIK